MRGAWAEELAAQKLIASGLTILSRNYRIPGGEIDLIAQEGQTFVFIEVKQRSKNTHGTAGECITPRKAALVRNAALNYLIKTFGTDNLACRFDAVLLHGTEKNYQLEWLQDAF